MLAARSRVRACNPKGNRNKDRAAGHRVRALKRAVAAEHASAQEPPPRRDALGTLKSQKPCGAAPEERRCRAHMQGIGSAPLPPSGACRDPKGWLVGPREHTRNNYPGALRQITCLPFKPKSGCLKALYPLALQRQGLHVRELGRTENAWPSSCSRSAQA